MTATLGMGAGHAQPLLPHGGPVPAGQNLGAPDAESALRAEIAKQAATAWARNDFATIDATADQYIRLRAKTLSGKWHLSIFYSALSEQMTIAWPEEWFVSDNIAGCRCRIPQPAHYADAEMRWDGLRAKMDQWSRADPSSPHAAIALAQFFVNRAGFYRGTGPSESVPAQAVPKVGVYLEEARKTLQAHRAAAASDPEWFDVMFVVATAQSWPLQKVDSLIQDLLDSGEGYATAYQSAATRLLPKWGGSYAMLEDFSHQAMLRTRSGEGEELYARIYWDVGAQEFAASRGDWPTLKRGFDQMLQRYPNARNLNGKAMFACAAGDGPTFRATMQQLGMRLMPAEWTIDPQGCIDHFAPQPG